MSRTFGEQIRRLRKARHLTMKELGETLGYSVDYIWKVETGRAYPSGKFIQALADFFGADLLLDVPEDSESRLIADQVVEKLPPETKRWLSQHNDIARMWLIFGSRMNQQGLTPDQVRQAVRLYQLAKECTSAENTDNRE